MIVLAIISSLLAALPSVMTCVNLAALHIPPIAPAETRVAILIPARDEEAGIAECVANALASTGVALEVIVLDDHSSDATAAIVEKIARNDPRLRLARAPLLPPGWSGKQHACHVLAQLTDAPYLLFLDADVHLEPEAAARLVGALAVTDLVSGVPRQRMGSLAELLVIPMINGLLLGYLPIPLARRDPRPALGAACGQMVAVRAERYVLAGGHASIPASLHDGLALPRQFRLAGLKTDVVAGASLAACRMYAGWRTVTRGTTKNAIEGMARPLALPVWTLLLLGGHVLPWLALASGLVSGRFLVAGPAFLACLGLLTANCLQAICCREPVVSILLRPFGALVLLALQWLALVRNKLGRSETWRGRTYERSGQVQSN